MTFPAFAFDNSYARALEGAYVPWTGSAAPAPKVLRLNTGLAEELGLDAAALSGPDGAAILSGGVAPEGSTPLAMAYAGHQFGGFSPQLGDGRALLLGEIVDRQGQRRDLHLKGSGKTPFSRGGDGKAVLGPVLREYLIGEAMHALGIPTTRALAATLTGEQVLRDGPKPGAVLARIAASHLRVGTFQFFAARGQMEELRKLADYAISRHYPELAEHGSPYLALLEAVTRRQAALVARWMGVGFVHGVMNTDNMTISGETIDYGPCAFMDRYDPATVFSSIDQHGRYAYGNQPGIAQWNLARLAEALLPIMPGDREAAVAAATDVVTGFAEVYERERLRVFRAKLGLEAEEPEDGALVDGLLDILEADRLDFTRFFRDLPDMVDPSAQSAQPPSQALTLWLSIYEARLARDSGEPSERRAAMDAVNPVYIPRNHKLEAALTAAVAGDMAPFDQLLALVSAPFSPVEGMESFAEPGPDGAGYVTFCGT